MAKEKNLERPGSQAARILFLIGLLVFVGAGGYWWRNVANSPRNVFYAMLNNSMRTRSVGRHIVQDNGAQKLDQKSHFSIGATPLANSITVLSQGDATSVTTRSIGTPTEDYVRYEAIETDQVGPGGRELNFESILGIWGKSDNASITDDTRGELFGESALGVIPIGFVAHEKRQELIGFAREHNVYEIEFSQTKKEIVEGRPVYVYDVTAESENYIRFLKQFAEAVGLTQLKNLDPSAFSEVAPFEFSVTVDVWSRQMTGIRFENNSRTETYGSYGQETTVVLPKTEEAISIEELQFRLQSLQ